MGRTPPRREPAEVASAGRTTAARTRSAASKRRARKTSRPIPIGRPSSGCSENTRSATASCDDRLFHAAREGRVRSTEYCGIRKEARQRPVTEENSM